MRGAIAAMTRNGYAERETVVLDLAERPVAGAGREIAQGCGAWRRVGQESGHADAFPEHGLRHGCSEKEVANAATGARLMCPIWA